jgi:hypothetical protein
MRQYWTILISTLVFQQAAQAYYTVQDTGELLQPNRYAAGAELQFLTSPESGANFLGRFDGAFDDEFNYRGYVGFGKIDFQAGGQVKWVPFPDIDSQPAVGFVAGALIANYEDHAEFTIRAYPLVSKKFETEAQHIFVPYAALPIAYRNYNSETDSPLQFVVGSKYVHPEYKGVEGYAELGLKLDDSVAYISVGANFPMNEDNKFDLQPEL